MTSSRQHRSWIFGTSRRATTAALAMALALMLMVVTTQSAQAQQGTLDVLHPFTGGADGALPFAGLTMDRAGNLYGTANVGGSAGSGHGTVFKLKRSGSGWTFGVLYAFTGNLDGGGPEARVIFGPNGNLYGTTTGGGPDNHGVVFRLSPPASFCRSISCPWTETVLYRFTGGADGGSPETGDVVFDQAGNLYGTTAVGGSSSQGVAYKLTPAHGLWTESVLYNFGGSAGAYPYSGMIFDSAGNLYGTTTRGGEGYGTVYELTPSGSGWVEQTLYTFQGLGDGGYPYGGLIFDQSGNLYGTTTYYGTVFKLTPSQGEWTKTILYTFTGNAGPNGTLTMDAAGNLFGITGQNDPTVDGEVFELTASGGYIDLYDFQAGADGAFPQGSVVLDASDNVYGTAELGGANGKGTVWEVIP
jgi:uncharacterized repeat protein (TIGR03803 family)